jgi:hypothetical protein
MNSIQDTLKSTAANPNNMAIDPAVARQAQVAMQRAKMTNVFGKEFVETVTRVSIKLDAGRSQYCQARVSSAHSASQMLLTGLNAELAAIAKQVGVGKEDLQVWGRFMVAQVLANLVSEYIQAVPGNERLMDGCLGDFNFKISQKTAAPEAPKSSLIMEP